MSVRWEAAAASPAAAGRGAGAARNRGYRTASGAGRRTRPIKPASFSTPGDAPPMFASMNAPTPNLSIAEGGVSSRARGWGTARRGRRGRRRRAAAARPASLDPRPLRTRLCAALGKQTAGSLLSGGADAREVEASTQQVVLEHLHLHRDLRAPARPPAALRKHAQSRGGGAAQKSRWSACKLPKRARRIGRQGAGREGAGLAAAHPLTHGHARAEERHLQDPDQHASGAAEARAAGVSAQLVAQSCHARAGL